MAQTATIGNNLAALVSKKGARDGALITISQLSRDTGIAMNTVKKYLRGEHDYYDGRIVAVFCKYLECEVGDLLKIVETGEQQDQ